ncbi:hypothetical protein Tco_0566300 [Tanacetum coccineum]
MSSKQNHFIQTTKSPKRTIQRSLHKEKFYKGKPIRSLMKKMSSTRTGNSRRKVNALPINTEAIAIITTIPEITPFIALQLRVAKLEQEMSKVENIDHSAAVLASIQSQVPIVVEKYVGTKIDDALLKALERHTADLVEKYSVTPPKIYNAAEYHLGCYFIIHNARYKRTTSKCVVCKTISLIF